MLIFWYFFKPQKIVYSTTFSNFLKTKSIMTRKLVSTFSLGVFLIKLVPYSLKPVFFEKPHPLVFIERNFYLVFLFCTLWVSSTGLFIGFKQNYTCSLYICSLLWIFGYSSIFLELFSTFPPCRYIIIISYTGIVYYLDFYGIFHNGNSSLILLTF